MSRRSWQVKLKRQINTIAHIGLRVWRVVCCGVAMALFGVWLWRIGQGIAEVSGGEMTSAQMLENMGRWLRGFGQ
ncbi:MAG: hypothetical protein E7625_07245 [Ruminococcaceae bacterium]|nr:hypothetical protein [Oscillospiraceae bacterium]